MRVPVARASRRPQPSPADLPRPPEHKTLWVALALHVMGGCLIGLHRIYVGKPEIVPYLILWFIVTCFMMIAHSTTGLYMLHALMIFLFADLVFLPGMVRRKNEELDAAYEDEIAQWR